MFPARNSLTKFEENIIVMDVNQIDNASAKDKMI